VVLGRGVLTTIAVAALVSFLPVLTNAVAAMRAAPASAVEFYRSLSAGAGVELFRIRLPHAVPQIFAAARITIPIAVTGALLAEWLATGRGLGYLIFSAGAQAQYSLVWGGSVALTAVSLVAYLVVGALERAALSRYAPALSRSLH
jgi:sulfonate transport system permease protein